MHDLRHLAPTLAALALAGLALGGCASVGDRPSPLTSAGPLDLDASAYGEFLAGEAAVNQGESAAAASYFGKAAMLDPGAEQGLLDTRAFTAALLAGDIDRAAMLAPVGPNADPGLRHVAALVRGVEAFATGNPRLARTILTSADAGAPDEPGAALLTPIAAAAAGEADASIIHPVIAGEPITQFYANLDQGKLFERAHRYEEAETAYRALIVKGDPGAIATLALGEMLERRGRRPDAVALYDAAIAARKGGAEVRAARERAAAGARPPAADSLKSLAAQALIAPATAQLVNKPDEIALVYLRLALRIDPTRDEAWMLVGDVLSSTADPAGAREAYLKVRPGSGDYVAARAKLAWNYEDAGEKDLALATARATLAAAPGNRDAAITLADVLRAAQRYDESAKVLTGLIGDHPETADWKLLYMRAVDFEESDHWPEAERDLKAALKQRPDEPELLNFLGYSWIDRGVNLNEGMAMVQKAVTLQPGSGAMIDSLGWAYYRLGNYPAAVEKLEAAIVLEPGDPDVNNHLGDAYWRVGRTIEAGFQWRHVLTLDPTPKLKAEAELKIARGLDAPPAAPVVAVK
jgi:tetratricopeptide (TPR) repeat protein